MVASWPEQTAESLGCKRPHTQRHGIRHIAIRSYSMRRSLQAIWRGLATNHLSAAGLEQLPEQDRETKSLQTYAQR